MKKLHIFFGTLMFFILTGCSGDSENSVDSTPISQKAMLTFAAVLNDPQADQNGLKQETGNLQECSDDSPAFLEVVVTRNGIPVVGTAEVPKRINIDPEAVDSNGDGLKEYLSQKAASLELDPGNYTLEYFAVLNADEEVIWITPVNDDNNESTNSEKFLPYDFIMAPGLNKQIDLEVVCFDNGIVFTAEAIEVLEFCIFGSYCNENGRHAEAMRVIASIWKYSGDEEEPRGELLFENVPNEITIVDNFEEETSETISEPLCFSLPITADNDEFYLEVTLGSGVGYDEEERVIRKGIITEEDIRSLFDGEDRLDYYHIREGNCNLEDSPQLLDVVNAEETD